MGASGYRLGVTASQRCARNSGPTPENRAWKIRATPPVMRTIRSGMKVRRMLQPTSTPPRRLPDRTRERPLHVSPIDKMKPHTEMAPRLQRTPKIQSINDRPKRPEPTKSDLTHQPKQPTKQTHRLALRLRGSMGSLDTAGLLNGLIGPDTVDAREPSCVSPWA